MFLSRIWEVGEFSRVHGARGLTLFHLSNLVRLPVRPSEWRMAVSLGWAHLMALAGVVDQQLLVV